MKVFHIHFGREGGRVRFLLALARSLHARGVEQEFFIRPRRGWRGEVEAFGRVHEGSYHIPPLRPLVGLRIRRAIGRFSPDALLAWAPAACQALPARFEGLRAGRLGDYPTDLRLFSTTDVLVCNAPDIAKRVRELGWTGALEVISNFSPVLPGVPVDRSGLSTPHDAFVVVALGRFVTRKGFDTLIKAMPRVPGAYLWLVGDGPTRGALERLAERLGVAERVRFVGWQREPAPYLAAADALAMPSRMEPLGNVILEAWEMGKPVVSTRAEGPAWMMTDGVDGLMVDADRPGGLAAALNRLRADKPLVERLVAGGRATLQARFSEAAVVDAYLRLLASAPAGSPGQT